MTYSQSMLADHQRMAASITILSMDAVEQAQSGHPGMPMGMADVATVLFSKFLKFDPVDPNWPDRDRFILSAGHGSMLLYSLLHLTGYQDMSLDQIKKFRQLGACTAGHPEYGYASGIETTTGPLGQGVANGVGFALAERHMNARYGDGLVDHYTYVMAGDGCLMEGISQEAISLAGHLQLSRLIVLWDDNNISIDGPVDISDRTNQLARFRASGWAVRSIDGHDPAQITAALRWAKRSNKPTLIGCRTTIAKGAPTKAGTSKAHGSPLGAEEVAAVRRSLNWEAPSFVVPKSVYDLWARSGRRGRQVNRAWQVRLSEHAQAGDFKRTQAGRLNASWQAAMKSYKDGLVQAPQVLATRAASGAALRELTAQLSDMVAGSADLEGSNKTRTPSTVPDIQAGVYGGRYINYGIREHAMAAVMNGMALHGGVIPYAGTFLVFADYCRPAIRLSALMGLRVIYVMTHDSIGVGEDGPTHQPVEHLASLRAIPNLHVYRPADAIETAECWELAVQRRDGPSVLALTRQSVPPVRRDVRDNQSARGGYIIAGDGDRDEVVLLATGSEVHLALEARAVLSAENIAVRVVSLPCFKVFAEQTPDYRNEVLGADLPRIGIEAAIVQGWEGLIGDPDNFIGMQGFGASAPAADLFDHFGITSAAIIAKIKTILQC